MADRPDWAAGAKAAAEVARRAAMTSFIFPAQYLLWQRGGYNRYAVKQASSEKQGRVASSNMFFDELEYGN